MFVEITYLDSVCFSLSNFSNVYFAQNKIRVIILISQISINVHRPIISPLFLYILWNVLLGVDISYQYHILPIIIFP